jgi:transposase
MREPGMAAERHWISTTIAAERDGMILLRVSLVVEVVLGPSCGVLNLRRRSWYQRRAVDLPLRGVTVRLLVPTRGWFCDHAACARRIFAEPSEGLLGRGARCTDAATALLLEPGLRAGGEAGARLARKAGLPASPASLLRPVRLLGRGAVAIPSLLGVDDFSLRRGCRQAALLVNLERHRHIDILPERDADPLAAWLKAHPGLELLVRDYAEAYADPSCAPLAQRRQL